MDHHQYHEQGCAASFQLNLAGQRTTIVAWLMASPGPYGDPSDVRRAVTASYSPG